MRITEAMSLNTVLLTENNVSQRMNDLSQSAASGVKVNQPSDDPAAYATIVQTDAQISTVQARSSAATSAANNLDLAGSILDQVTTLLQKARSIAVEGANGTQTAASNANSASEIQSIFQQIVSLANTQGANGYLFGGTKNTSQPFDTTGNYLGNSGVTHVEVADGVLAVSNADGQAAFNDPAGRNVFADLQTLATALQNNDTAGIQASITNIDASNTQVVAAQVNTGVLSDRLHSATNVMTNTLTQLQTDRGSVADADVASTMSNLQATQTAYQMALQVNRQILSLAMSQASG